MAGVQAQVDELGVGAVEEAVDVLLGVDVAVGVRMVLRTHAVLLEHRLAEFVHALGLLRHCSGVRLRSSSTAPVAGSRHISGMTTTCLPPTAASFATSSICFHTQSHESS